MRGLALFVAGLLLGLAVQTGFAQSGDNIVGLNHVGINVTDFDAAMKFYTEQMGFRKAFVVNDKDGKPTQGYIHISRNTFIEIRPAGNQPTGITHVGIEVDNIKAALARLAKNGVKVEEPRPGINFAIIANAFSPEGARFELSELGPDSLQRKAINSYK
jgi:catechol 2,3-dioxygenase-like lactoylglutathione lyase family enzyme